MTKQTLLINRPKQWAKDKKALAQTRSAFWEHIETLARIVESGTYLEEFATVEEFADSEGFSRSRFYEAKTSCEVRQRLSEISGAPPTTESHLKAISKAPPDKQKAVFAAVSEKVEAENRKPTAKDYRQAVKPYLESTEPPKNPEEPAGIQSETVDTFGPIAGDIPPDAEIAAPVIQHRDEPPKEVWEDTAEGSLEPETEEMTDAELVWGFGVFEIAQWIKHDATESDAETLRTCLDAKFPQEPKPKKRNGFQPPTMAEVEIYADSYGLERPDWPKQPDVADRFFDHFESNGWKVGGKAPMKDWKAALRNFGRNDFGNGKPKDEPCVGIRSMRESL